MRRYLVFALSLISVVAHANSTLRVGSQVLSVGDSAGRVTDLLGKPSSKSHGRSASSGGNHGGRSRRRSGGVAGVGSSVERLHFQHDGHYITVTLTDGRVSDIEDRSR